MAKPDCDDGWTPLAHELLAALLCAKIPHEARVVLSIVLLQVYGPAKRKEAKLDAPEIARMTGLRRQNVWRGISFLTGSGLLRMGPGGGYRFVKDHEAWRSQEGRLVTPELGVFAVFAPTLAMSYKYPNAANTKAKNERIETDSQSESVDGSRESKLILSENRNGFSQRIETDSLIPIREKDKEKDDEEAGAGPPESESGNPPDLNRPFDPDPARLAQVLGWVETVADPFEEVGSKVQIFKTSYPLDWIEAAVLCGAAAAARGKVWAYAHRCLLDWWERGQPGYEEIAAARGKVGGRPPAAGFAAGSAAIARAAEELPDI